MATSKNTKAAVLEDESVEAEVAELTPKQIINEGIVKVLEASGVGVQHARYKAMRAIAYQAFVEAIESDDFEGLVDRAIAGLDELPSGWEIEKHAAEEEAPKPAAKRASAKAPAKEEAPAKAPAKRAPRAAAAKAPAATARKRPSR